MLPLFSLFHLLQIPEDRADLLDLQNEEIPVASVGKEAEKFLSVQKFRGEVYRLFGLFVDGIQTDDQGILTTCPACGDPAKGDHLGDLVTLRIAVLEILCLSDAQVFDVGPQKFRFDAVQVLIR